jgi:hypothetical protein
MEDGFNKILHNYMVKLVIFTVFLFKSKRGDEERYLFLITEFIRKRINSDLKIELDVGPKRNIQDERDIYIESILSPTDEIKNLNLILVSFTTNMGKITLQIDLNKEEKYMDYIYS